MAFGEPPNLQTQQQERPVHTTTTTTHTMDESAHGEAHYRDVLLQMQSEFSRTFAALEKQISCLTTHNELLVTAQQQQQAYVLSLCFDTYQCVRGTVDWLSEVSCVG